MEEMIQLLMYTGVRLGRCNLYFCEPGEQTPQRILPYPYFLYVHSGQGIYNIGGTDIVTRPGQMYFCPRYTANTIKADRDDPFVLTGIEFEMQIPDETVNRLWPRALNIPSDSLTFHLLDEMIRHSEHLMAISEDSHALFRAFLLRILAPRTTSARRDPDGRQMLEYLYLHRLENITLAHLAERFHYHPNQLNRQIQALTHMTVHQLLIEYRLQHACDMLRNTAETVTQIARVCGYENPNYFCQLFRQKRGCSPLEYRRQHTAP